MLVALTACNFVSIVAVCGYLLRLLVPADVNLAVSALLMLPVAGGLAIHLARLILHYALAPLPKEASRQPIVEPVPLVVPVIMRRESDIEMISRCVSINLPFVARLPMVFLLDLRDADSEIAVEDRSLMSQLHSRLEADIAAERIVFLTRRRVYDPVDRVWRGWERKRGKLEEFCRLLQGTRCTSFEDPLPEPLRGTSAFVTIDVDTRLLPDTIEALMQSADRHAAIVTPMLEDTCRAGGTWFERLHEAGTCRFAFNPHLNFNQSRLGYDLFYGKGLIIVDRFLARTEGRIAERTILSHDHLEAMLAGAVASSTAIVREDVPISRAAWARRQYRWTRGDFQVVPWIIWSDLHWASRLHLLEVVLNHLLPTCCLALAVIFIIASPTLGGVLAVTISLLLARPALALLPVSLPLILLDTTAPMAERASRVRSVIVSECAAWLLNFAYAPGNGLLVLRAAGVVAWRRGWSGRNLLQWEESAPETPQSAAAAWQITLWTGLFLSIAAFAGPDGPTRAIAGAAAAWCALPLLFGFRPSRRKFRQAVELHEYNAAKRSAG